MAELGHPVMGPQSYWKLTPAEIRIYAEGMEVRSQKQEEEYTYEHEGGTSPGPSMYNKESKKKRDQQALESVSQKVREQRNSGSASA